MTPLVIADTSLDEEPISLIMARSHLKLEVDPGLSPPGHEDDPMVELYIVAARQWAEEHLERSISLKTLEVGYDRVSGSVLLPRPPVVDIDSIIYRDASNAQQTLALTGVSIDQYNTQAWVFPPPGGWPALSGVVNAFRIRYRAGYTRANCPRMIQFAMLLLIGHMYENHEAVTVGTTANEVPLGVIEMLRPYRVGLSMA